MKAEDVKVCVIRIEGTNCEDEMANAFSMVGAQAEKVHLKQLIGQALHIGLIVPDIDDVSIAVLLDRQRYVHIVCVGLGGIALLAGDRREDIGRDGQFRIRIAGAGELLARVDIQHVVVAASCVDAQRAGEGGEHLGDVLRAVLLRGRGAQIVHQLRVHREHVVHLVIELLLVEAAHASDEERAYHQHQGGYEQKHDEYQFGIQAPIHRSVLLTLTRSPRRILYPYFAGS